MNSMLQRFLKNNKKFLEKFFIAMGKKNNDENENTTEKLYVERYKRIYKQTRRSGIERISS